MIDDDVYGSKLYDASKCGWVAAKNHQLVGPLLPQIVFHVMPYPCIYIYGKCLGFARTRNDDGRRIIIIIIINIIKPLLTIFNECRSLTGVGELNPY